MKITVDHTKNIRCVSERLFFKKTKIPRKRVTALVVNGSIEYGESCMKVGIKCYEIIDFTVAKISSDLNGLTMYPQAPRRMASAAVSTDL